MKIFSEEKLFFAAFLCNLVLFFCEIAGLVLAVIEMGAGLFFYYTELSNILVLLSSFFFLLSFFFNVWKGCGTNFPTHLFRFAATSASTLTFLVVVTVLIPMVGAPVQLLFGGSMLFHHTLCPLLSMVSFMLFEKEETRNLKYKHLPFALIFTLIYGAIFIVLNVLRVYDGPYPFLRVYNQPVWMSIIWFVVIIGMAGLISFLLCLANKKIFQRGVIHG